ncbi:MAG TPA: alpha-1,2-fucosyltransferase [Xanthobacteraceae bacterium]|nr:alpha-1,2-fucosyltransferase [Xanthobacteraceae bacterium]
MASNLVAVTLSGGLGNQLFQYAAALALARRHGVRLFLDTSLFRRWSEPRAFALQPLTRAVPQLARVRLGRDGATAAVIGGARQQLTVFREQGFDYDPRFEQIGPGVLLQGYWQSYRYFDSISAELGHALKGVAAGLDARNKDLLAEISAKPSIGVHVRRGDYLVEPYKTPHGVCSLDYYRGNVERLLGEHPGCAAYVFSDDPAWCRAALGDLGVRVVDHNGPRQAHIDLLLLSACQAHVLSNSSFSWWGAYLAEKRLRPPVVPIPWFRTRSATPDLFPPQWEQRSRTTNEPLEVVKERVKSARVSVVIPAHGRPAMLKEAVASVLQQTKPASEIIIVLTEATPECAAAAHDLASNGIVRVVSTSEPFLSKVRNEGVHAATGEWIAFLDDDDVWRPQKLELQLAAALLLGVGVVSCDFTSFNTSGDISGPGLAKAPAGLSLGQALVLGNFVSGGSAAIVRANLFRQVGGFDESLRASEDVDLWRRLSWHTEIVLLSDKLVRIRRHEGQMTRNPSLVRLGHRTLFAKMCADTPKELRSMLFPTGLFFWYVGSRTRLSDLIKTLPDFLADPVLVRKLVGTVMWRAATAPFRRLRKRRPD